MDKKLYKQDPTGGISEKKEKNAGSGSFNQGSKQDPDYNNGTQVSDEEKETGHSPAPVPKNKENRKSAKKEK